MAFGHPQPSFGLPRQTLATAILFQTLTLLVAAATPCLQVRDGLWRLWPPSAILGSLWLPSVAYWPSATSTSTLTASCCCYTSPQGWPLAILSGLWLSFVDLGLPRWPLDAALGGLQPLATTTATTSCCGYTLPPARDGLRVGEGRPQPSSAAFGRPPPPPFCLGTHAPQPFVSQRMRTGTKWR